MEAQGRIYAVTVAIIPAIVSMSLSAKTIQRDIACVHKVAHIVLLIDVDQDIPVRPAVRVRVLMHGSDSPILGPYRSAGVKPVGEGETCHYDCQNGQSNDELFPRGLRPPSKENG